MISIVLPTKGRPDNLRRLHRSVTDTATDPIQFSIYADDDLETADVGRSLDMVVTAGPHIVLSEMWNVAQRAATGDIFMLCGDDVIFRTPGWDQMVEAEFAKVPDRILLVHGDDLSGNAHNGSTYGFVHRNWVNAVGFVPGIFECDYVDAWQNYLADALGRRVYLPDLITEHLHPSFGKAVIDATYRGGRDRYRDHRVYDVWDMSEKERMVDVEKLRNLISDGVSLK